MLGEGSSEPTISSASWRAVTSVGSTVRTVVPRRITVISSATESTSSSLWLMKMTEMPSFFSPRRLPNSSSTSCGTRTAVGSSRITMLRAAVEDLEDLHALAGADAELLDQPVGLDAEAVGVRDPLDLGAGLAADAVQPLGAEDDVLEDGEVVGQHEVLEHHADAGLDRVGRGVQGDLRCR